MGKTAARVEWKKRTRHETTLAAQRRIWETVDGRFRVVKSRSLYGLPTVWYAMRRHAGSWEIISKHTKQARARAAVERAAQVRTSE